MRGHTCRCVHVFVGAQSLDRAQVNIRVARASAAGALTAGCTARTAGAFAERPLVPLPSGPGRGPGGPSPSSTHLGREVWPAPPGLAFGRRRGLCAHHTQAALVRESGTSLAWRGMSTWASPAPNRPAAALPGAGALPKARVSCAGAVRLGRPGKVLPPRAVPAPPRPQGPTAGSTPDTGLPSGAEAAPQAPPGATAQQPGQ